MITFGSTQLDSKLIIIYGNCQTVPLAMQLAAADTVAPENRAYVCVLNHALPGKLIALPSAEQLSRCILYLEQYDSAVSALPVRDMLRQKIPRNCPRLVFPTFMMFCFWPFECTDPRNAPEPNFPWGRYPHGDSLALELVSRGLKGEEAINTYMDISLQRMPDLQLSLQRDIARIARHDQASDVHIGDYVIANFRRKHLFLTTGHVCNDALHELGRRLYQKVSPILGSILEEGLDRIEKAIATYTGMSSFQMPIHPYIARELGLEFYDEQLQFNWFGNAWSFQQFIGRYIAYDRDWYIQIPQSKPVPAQPVDIYQASAQLSAARSLRWMPGRITIDNREITIDGWALTTWDQSSDTGFLLNGEQFDHVEWPIASPDMLAPFGAIPHADQARFRCRKVLEVGTSPYLEGFARFNIVGQYGEHQSTYRTAWFVCDPRLEQVPAGTVTEIPPAHLGGATITKRIQYLLEDRFERSLNSFESVLDLHCGYLTHYLAMLCPKVTGVSSMAEHILQCERATPTAHFHLIDRMPPTPFATASFDLVIGIALLSQFDIEQQHSWLTELQRIVSPQGLVLLSLPGMAQAVLHGAPHETLWKMHQQGIYCTETQAPEFLRSHDYVWATWGKYFEVLEIIESMAGHQDLVVMRNNLSLTHGQSMDVLQQAQPDNQTVQADDSQLLKTT
ncbi:WcbI family polysaccharide biosynthesis putative acetyltransferase [Nitrincola sp.]|uniref:WcbI family polysaccharide biosynthesis putative acetyltransferase n=1 Tax=Nitrincola sp. TaxID=1926584 RepID=UPI003A927CA4